MSVCIENRPSKAWYNRKKKTDESEMADMMEDERKHHMRRSGSERIHSAVKSGTSGVLAGGRGIYSGVREQLDNLNCQRAVRKLQQTTVEDKIPKVLAKVDSACGPASDKQCDRFMDAMVGHNTRNKELMMDSNEYRRCSERND